MFRRLFPKSPRSRRSPRADRRSAFRPQMEALESREAPAAQRLVFNIDPVAGPCSATSTTNCLSVAGTVTTPFGPATITQQGPGSLTTRFTGRVVTQYDPVANTIQFIQNGTLADASINGNWEPLPGGAPGSAPADFGAQVTILITTAKAALRNVGAAVASAPLLMMSGTTPGIFTFTPTMDLSLLPGGTFDYNEPLLGLSGSEDLPTSPRPNAATRAAEFRVLGNGEYKVEVPINVRIVEDLGGGFSADFTISGVLSGTARTYLAFGADANSDPAVGPRVRVVGATAPIAERFNFLAFDASFSGGVRVALGDFTGDGIDDILAASGPGIPSEVRAYDGASAGPTPTLLVSAVFGPVFPGGIHLAAGDFSGDGRDDVVFAPDAGQIPFFLAWDVVNSVTTLGLAYEVDFTGGVRVALADTNADGKDDLITAPGPGRAPTVRVWDLTTGLPTQNFDAFDASFTGGVFVSGGDVNNDGKADIAAGQGSGSGGGSLARVFDVANSTLVGPPPVQLSEVTPYAGFTGAVRVALRDVNGDGVADLVTVPGAGQQARAKAFNGTTGAVILDPLGTAAIFPASAAYASGAFVV